MKHYVLKIFLFALLLACFNNVSAQLTAVSENAEAYIEQVALQTDRETYVVNETLYFKAVNCSNDELKSVDWSKVLYVEIITCAGKSVYQGKYIYDKNGAMGSIVIPTDILTGNYYLKAYTKWMRNYSNTNYSYKPICIINPYSKSLFNVPDDYTSDYTLDTIIYRELEDLTCEVKSNTQNNLSIDLHNTAKTLNKQEPLNYSLSVVSQQIETNTYVLNPQLPISYKKTSSHYLPETRGVSVSGAIVNAENKKPLAYVWVHLTIFGDFTESLSIISDSLGRFNFSLPSMEGAKELFISCESKDDIKPEIRVDNDFCTAEINLPFIPFGLNADLWNLYNKLSLSMQIENEYKAVITAPKADSNYAVSYYHKPTVSVILEEYIKLPTIEDYFTEFIPIVSIKGNKEKKSISVMGVWSELTIYPPLVLVDHLIITDVIDLLKVSPEKIESIEVLDYPYVSGSITYGGVINLKSKENDLGGIDLPESGLFFNYETYSENPVDKTVVLSKDKNNPGVTNTLYWNPGLEFSGSNNMLIDINAGNNSGPFQIIIQSTDGAGKLSRYVKTLNSK